MSRDTQGYVGMCRGVYGVYMGYVGMCIGCVCMYMGM